MNYDKLQTKATIFARVQTAKDLIEGEGEPVVVLNEKRLVELLVGFHGIINGETEYLKRKLIEQLDHNER